MFSSKWVVQYNLFGNNGFENTLFCKCEGSSEEISEINSEGNQVIDNLESEIEKLRQER